MFRVTASLWFILEVCTTTVLATVWCHALRAMNAASSALFEFLGALAVAGSEGDVQIFGLIYVFQLQSLLALKAANRIFAHDTKERKNEKTD